MSGSQNRQVRKEYLNILLPQCSENKISVGAIPVKSAISTRMPLEIIKDDTPSSQDVCITYGL